MVEGQNQQSRNDKATEFKGGTVHFLDSNNAIDDTDTTITPNASVSTSDSDWGIVHDNAAGTTELENVNPIDFGAVSGFTVDQVVIESPTTSGNYIIDNNPSGDVDLSGDGSTTIPATSLNYTFGSE